MDDFVSQRVSSPEQQPPAAFAPQPPRSRLSGLKAFYRANKWYVWAIVVGVLIIGTLAFFAFRPQKVEPVKEANVAVNIDAPSVAPSGGDVIYKLKVENQDSTTLVGIELELVYPNGITYISSTPKPENLSGSIFKVPDLNPGQNAVIIVKTSLQGNVNDEKTLVARLHYRFSNFNSEFVKEQSFMTRITASDVKLDIAGPETTTNSAVNTYDITYRNDSDRDIQNARIQVTYPEEFSYADSNPKPNLGQNIWNIGTLKSAAVGKISFQGSFRSARPGQAATFKIEFLVPDSNGNYFTQSTVQYITTISSTPLLIEHSLQGNDAKLAKPGDVLSYEIKYQNNSATVASAVTIVATIDSNAVDLRTIRSETGTTQDNTITWNASSVSGLERLNPNESGTVRFSVQLKNPAVKDTSKNLEVKTNVKIKANEYSTFLPGNDIAVKVTSPSSLKGSAAFVSGQLPPKVGQSSTFQVILELRNSTNDYREGVLTGFVPIGVTVDQASITAKERSSVAVDTSTGKVTWNVGQLAAHTGDFSPVRKLTFNVRFAPTLTQSGQAVTLFKTIGFTAVDTFTNQNISLSAEDIATDDIPDGDSKGRVE